MIPPMVPQQGIQNFNVPIYPSMSPYAPVIVQTANYSPEQILVISNLNPKTQEADIKAHLNNANVIIKVMKDLVSRVSRRFGFITCQSKEEATQLRDEFNYTMLQDYEIRLNQKRYKTEFVKDANVFIRGVPTSWKSKDLDQFCSQFGVVYSVSIRTDDKGASLGYGYVQFENIEAAKKSIEYFQTNKLDGNEIKADIFQSRNSRIILNTNIYIKDLPTLDVAVGEEIIKKHFFPIGKVTCHAVALKENNGQKYLNAFVAYETKEEAEKAIEMWNNKPLPEFEEKPLSVCFVKSRAIRKAEMRADMANYECNLVMKSLRGDVTAEEIKEVFSKLGEIDWVYLGNPVKGFPYRTKADVGKPPYTEESDKIEMRICIIRFKSKQMAEEVRYAAKVNEDVHKLLTPTFNPIVDFIYPHLPRENVENYMKMKRTLRNMELGSRQTFGMNMIMPGMMPAMGVMPQFPMGMMANINTPPHIADSQFHTSTSTSSRPNEPEQTEDEEEKGVEWINRNIQKLREADTKERETILGNVLYKMIQ